MSQNADEIKTAEPNNPVTGNDSETSDPSEIQPNPNAPKKSIIREYFESLVVTLIMAFFGMTFIVQAVTVPTGSMQNTINIGDHFLVNKFIYAQNPLPFLPQREIRRGDIVVFKYPGNPVNPAADRARNIVPYEINYIKRVIGLPGDTVEFRNNQVFINGNLLPEHRVIGDIRPPRGSNPEKVTLTVKEFEQGPEDAKYTVYYNERSMNQAKNGTLPQDPDYNFGVPGKPSVVPPDSYFMMGDARDNSEDSRFWGFVHKDLVIGRAMFVYWSCDQSYDESFVGCLTHPRFNRIGTMIK